MNQPISSAPDTERRGKLVLQTLPILLIPFFVGAVTFLVLKFFFSVPHPTQRPDGGPLPVVVALIVFFSALIMLVRMGRARLSIYLLIGVWTLATTWFALQAGVTTIGFALLILPICAAGLLIDGAASISLAGLATILVGALGWLEMNAPRANTFPPDFLAPLSPMLAAAFWICVFWSVAALTWLLANGLQRALKTSYAHAAELRALSAELEQRVQTQTAALLEQEREAAMLEERARVAREIHDTIAQGLTGIIVQLGAAERALAATSPDAPQHLQLAQQMARESLAEARRSIWNLRSPTLEHGTLVDALRGVAARQTNVPTTFELRGEPRALAAAIESALLRVCQESLVNVTKHANATRAQVELEFLATQVCLRVSDDGIGFDEESLQTPDGVTSGFGLLGMRERIGALGGALDIKNENGARVLAAIPYGEIK
jgi:signal transduction histidine kinase